MQLFVVVLFVCLIVCFTGGLSYFFRFGRDFLNVTADFVMFGAYVGTSLCLSFVGLFFFSFILSVRLTIGCFSSRES